MHPFGNLAFIKPLLFYPVKSSLVPDMSLYVLIKDDVSYTLLFLNEEISQKEDGTWVIKHPFSDKELEIIVCTTDNHPPKVFINCNSTNIEEPEVGVGSYRVTSESCEWGVTLLQALILFITTLLFYFIGMVGFFGGILALFLTRMTYESDMHPLLKSIFYLVWWGSLVFYWYQFEFVGGLSGPYI